MPALENFGGSDYRLYNPDGDCNSKLDHVEAMLTGAVLTKPLPLAIVLIDSWYATKKLIAVISGLGKVYYCPLKTNRLGNDSRGSELSKQIDQLTWSATEAQQGKLIKLRRFPRLQEGETVPCHCLYRQDGIRRY